MKINTVESLAVRLTAVETKLNTLSGLQVPGVDASSIQELDLRLCIVESAAKELTEQPAVDAVTELVTAAAYQSTISISDIVALSPSAEVPEAAAIVTAVLNAQAAAPAVTDTQVIDITTAALAALVNAEVDVVTDMEALTDSILSAVYDVASIDDPASVQTAIDSLVNIIEQASGTTASLDVIRDITDAVISCPVEQAIIDLAYDVAVNTEAVDVVVNNIVANSPSANVPAAADIVSSVVKAVVIAEPETNPAIVDAISTAIAVVVNAEPEVVQDPIAITAAITEAIRNLGPSDSDVIQLEIASIVNNIVANATNVKEVTPEIKTMVLEAVAADPVINMELDELDERLTKIEEMLNRWENN